MPLWEPGKTTERIVFFLAIFFSLSDEGIRRVPSSLLTLMFSVKDGLIFTLWTFLHLLLLFCGNKPVWGENIILLITMTTVSKSTNSFYLPKVLPVQ